MYYTHKKKYTACIKKDIVSWHGSLLNYSLVSNSNLNMLLYYDLQIILMKRNKIL